MRGVEPIFDVGRGAVELLLSGTHDLAGRHFNVGASTEAFGIRHLSACRMSEKEKADPKKPR